MRGSSRGAFAAGQRALAQALQSGVDWSVLVEDLFSMTAVLDSSASLRRAMTDPSRDAAARRGLVSSLFGSRVSEQAIAVVSELAAQRWSEERDLTDALELLAVETVVASADAGGRLDAVEDELFRLSRVVTGNVGLREALWDRGRSAADKETLIGRLVQGKVTPETLRLARQAVHAPRGRHFDRVLETYVAVAAKRREQLTAVVTAAVPLDDTQRHRLAQALSGIYGKSVQVNVVLDPEVVGGIRVQVGDEVVDGTILRRLEEARRLLAG
jgi:F-type H+-transporting ATPase subunit delta